MTSQSILITGAGSGLGRDLCRHFAAAGMFAIAADQNAAAAEETARAVRDAGHAAQALELDVTCEPAVSRAIQALPGQRVDVLINNAGIQHVAALEDFPAEKWSLMIDIMLKGSCWMTRAVLPGMRERKYGRIVNIGSIHSLVASPFKSAYVAAKHGLLGFAKTVALETADTDITINTLCPSYIQTPLVDKQIKAQAEKHGISESEVIDTIMLKPMPKRAFITADEIAGTIEFLISPAARNITGQTITLDGGWTAT
jgi:3-hydroxybutyrate dehydrogenase